MPAKPNDTALVLLVPEAEPVVGNWRDRHDPAAATGMPAHITVLYPFLPMGQVDDRVLRNIESLASGQRPFAIEFSDFGEFPGVLWLDPASDEGRRLTEVVLEQWPALVPYGNPELEIVPHLTVTDGADAAVVDQARREIARQLPFSAQVESLALMTFGDGQWSVECKFMLGGS